MKLKFFIITECTTLRKVGSFPQIEDAIQDYNINKQNSFKKLSFNSFPDFEPDLNCFFLNKKAKITDLISSFDLRKNIGLFINDKLKKIFQEHLITSHKYYQATLNQGFINYNYHFMHLINSWEFENEINFQKSQFCIKKLGIEKVSDIEILSFADYKEKQAKILEKDATLGIGYEKLHFNSYFNKDIAIFRLPFQAHVYISEKLKRKLEEEKITGIEIENAKLEFEIS